MEYLINKKTLYLEKNNENINVIIKEFNKKIHINNSLKNIIDEGCKYYGSSYYGRKISAKYLLNIKSKLPIILSEELSLILFPIYSDRKAENIWLVFNNIKNYYKKNNHVEILFKDSSKKEIDCTYYLFNQQYLNCCKLCTIFFLKKNKFL